MNKKMSGFTPVYRYTVSNAFKSGKFLGVTIGIGLLLLIGIMALLVILGNPSKDEEKPFEITKAYVYDKTGLGVPDYATYAQLMESEEIQKVTFIPCSDDKKAIEDNKEADDFVLVVSEENEDGFLITVVSGEATKYEDDNLEKLAEELAPMFQYHVYSQSGLSDESLMQALIPVTSTVVDFGEDEDGMKEIIEIIVFLGTLMIIYMVTLIYGQQICTEVSIEKSSKLVEQLLVSVSPYGLVSGKVLGVITTSLLQFLIWIGCILGGVFGGDAIANMIYDDYVSKLKGLIDAVKPMFGEMAFEPVSIVVAVVLLLTGLAFYLVLAGFAGSFVTKPENATNVQVIFIFPILISFFITLFSITETEGKVANYLHFIPFTSSMVTPASMFVGSIPVWMGLVSFAISAFCTVLILYLAAKIYKGLLFFGGNKLTPSVIMRAIKSKN